MPLNKETLPFWFLIEIRIPIFGDGSRYHWLVEFYGISTLGGYLMPNPFYFKLFSLVLVKILFTQNRFYIIQMSKQFYIKQSSLVKVEFQYQKQFYFKQLSLV